MAHYPADTRASAQPSLSALPSTAPTRSTRAVGRVTHHPTAAATTLALLLLAATLAVGARRTGLVPPLGPFLEPAHGVWALARSAELPRSSAALVPGLGSTVRVVYDDRAVPHIYAATEADAYRALGYVVARDRLFQMELQTRATAGRLSEWAGPLALPLDREMRSLGLARAATRAMAALDTSSEGGRALTAYASGVNAWIAAMRPAELPLEYRLLGARPEPWRPINSVYLVKRLGWTLAHDDPALERLRVAALVGDEAARALVPMNSPLQIPIVPNGEEGPRLTTRRLPPPGAPDSAAQRLVALATPAARELARSNSELARRADALGSNNWAVSPARSRSGAALLAGDPHLELTLPSIWYEAHLVVPGRLDVYGVTIPGLPFIVLGFNRDIAWSFTNTGADVLDRYTEVVDDTARPTRYRLDGAWRPLELRTERYLGRRGELLGVDTVRFTHRGPLVRSAAGPWVSLRWTVLDSTSGEAQAAVRAARARTAAEFERAMSEWTAPAQNMLVADRAGTIAIRSTGHFPVRPGDGRGDVVRDGSTSASDWRGMWPLAAYPRSTRPAQGFLASANQQPVDPSVDSSYLGAAWPAPWRAIEIARLLRADSSVTPDAMRRYQTDAASARADVFVPALLGAASRRRAAPAAAALLAAWDRRYTRASREAVLFELAMEELARRTWDELAPRAGTTSGGERAREDGDAQAGDAQAGDARAGADAPAAGGRAGGFVPGDAVLVQLLGDSASPWWDDRATTGRVERRDDILAASLTAAYDSALSRYGPPGSDGWRWDRIRQANIWHALRRPTLSALGVRVSGGTGTISPLVGDGEYGASWRVVVELGPTVRAWGIYPGGQSGNPASRRYMDRLPRWAAGALDTLRVPARPEALPANQVTSRLILEPAP